MYFYPSSDKMTINAVTNYRRTGNELSILKRVYTGPTKFNESGKNAADRLNFGYLAKILLEVPFLNLLKIEKNYIYFNFTLSFE